MSTRPGTVHFGLLLCLLCACRAATNTERIVVQRPKNAKFEVLVGLDGGGIRLLLSNQILIELERNIKRYFLKHPKHLPPDAGQVTSTSQLEVHIADFVDCIGGVSAGSWVGFYYASKGGNGAAAKVLSNPQIVRKYGHIYPGSALGIDVFFYEYGSKIFPKGLLARLPSFELRPGFRFPLKFPGINAPLYPIRGLEEALFDFLGDTRMTELSTSCVVHVYDVVHSSPVLFSFSKNVAVPHSSATVVRSRSAPRYDIPVKMAEVMLEEFRMFTQYEPDLDIRMDEDFYIKDVARGSSAVPVLFPAKVIKPVGNETRSYLSVDGGLVAPNPTMHSANFMLRMQRRLDLKKIAILSIGTGHIVGKLEQSVGGGAVGWLTGGDFIRVVFDGGSEAVQANIDFFLYNGIGFPLGQYLRIQTFAQSGSEDSEALLAVDDVSHLSALEKIGRTKAREYRGMIRTFVADYIFPTAEKTGESNFAT